MNSYKNQKGPKYLENHTMFRKCKQKYSGIVLQKKTKI